MTEFAKRLVGSIGTAAVANRQATRCPPTSRARCGQACGRRRAVRWTLKQVPDGDQCPADGDRPVVRSQDHQSVIVDDPICTNDGGNVGAHGQYVANGMVDQAAVFAAQHL